MPIIASSARSVAEPAATLAKGDILPSTTPPAAAADVSMKARRSIVTSGLSRTGSRRMARRRTNKYFATSTAARWRVEVDLPAARR
jgi:hypothetical protein